MKPRPTQSLQVGDSIEVKIEKLVYGGSGLARYNNFVVFTPYTSVGDIIKVQITKKKKSFAEARTLEFIKKGRDHIGAACPVFGICGGCDWQNTSYTAQVEQKKEILKETLQNFYNKEIPWHLSDPWQYRNRIQVKALNNIVGFYKKASRELVDAGECKIIEKELLEKIEELKKQTYPKKQKMEIFKNLKGEIEVSLNKKTAKESGFNQVNTAVNKQLLNEVLKWLQSVDTKDVYDLYCGQGNFSSFLQNNEPSLKITAVDHSKTNIKRAKEKNTAVNYICSDVLDWLKKTSIKVPSLIILDPPRQGLDKNFIDLLKKKSITNMIYISCNPMTLKRDLVALKQDSMEVIDCKAFDMFPQTYHFEVACLLKFNSLEQ